MTDATHADAIDTAEAMTFSAGTPTVPPLFRVDAAANPARANQFSAVALVALDELLGEGEEFGLSSNKAWLVRQLMHAREAAITHSLCAA